MSPRRVTTRFYRRNAPKDGTAPATRGRKREDGYATKGERAYAELLDGRKHAGHVAGWWYEAMSWKLVDDTHYRPDFLVLLADGTLEVHEVKAGKGDDFNATEVAWLKLKVAARDCPIPLVIVWESPKGCWQERRL